MVHFWFEGLPEETLEQIRSQIEAAILGFLQGFLEKFEGNTQATMAVALITVLLRSLRSCAHGLLLYALVLTVFFPNL
ncbi:hypothetical protein SUGI_0084140 [Cryptomeria japonica]|nr:hypothetical protein SUGI_0084140 [Cryptomeria japonica]